MASGAVTRDASSSSESHEENVTFNHDTTDPPARSNDFAATNAALPEAGNNENHLTLLTSGVTVENTVEAEFDLLEQLVNATDLTQPENMMEECDPGLVEVEKTYVSVSTVITAIPIEGTAATQNPISIPLPTQEELSALLSSQEPMQTSSKIPASVKPLPSTSTPQDNPLKPHSSNDILSHYYEELKPEERRKNRIKKKGALNPRRNLAYHDFFSEDSDADM